jgi:hypothetical protein
MDSDRFDGLARTLSQTRSRRQTLRGLAAAVAGGALVLGGPHVSAGPRCKALGRGCKNIGDCCPSLVCFNNGKRKTCQSCILTGDPCPDVDTCSDLCCDRAYFYDGMSSYTCVDNPYYP